MKRLILFFLIFGQITHPFAKEAVLMGMGGGAGLGSIVFAAKSFDPASKAKLLRKKLLIDCLSDVERAEEIAKLKKQKARWSERLNEYVSLKDLDFFKAKKMTELEVKELISALDKTEFARDMYRIASAACLFVFCGTGAGLAGFAEAKKMAQKMYLTRDKQQKELDISMSKDEEWNVKQQAEIETWNRTIQLAQDLIQEQERLKQMKLTGKVEK